MNKNGSLNLFDHLCKLHINVINHQHLNDRNLMHVMTLRSRKERSVNTCDMFASQRFGVHPAPHEVEGTENPLLAKIATSKNIFSFQ